MKHFSAAAALASALLLMTACSGASSEISYTPEEELPYGATLTIDREHIFTIQYDHRFLTAEAMEQIVNYYTAIQTNDGELFGKVQMPLYHEYCLTEMFGDEITDAGVMESTHKAYVDFNDGKEFAFSFIDITECYNQLDDAETTEQGNELKALLDTLMLKEDKPLFSETSKAMYELRVTRYVTDAGSGIKTETNKSIADELLYLAEYEGGWYIMYT